MVTLGYSLSSEENAPSSLVRHAQLAEEAGFEFAMISDHYHPWTTAQGNGPMVWPVIGGIAATTSKIRLGTGVTCPTVRIHPGIIAQAAATAASLMPGRFMLGVGSGEALNEHIFGDPWPRSGIRLEMLEEAIDLIRALWTGEETSFDGRFYTVDRACLFTLPPELPPILVAGTAGMSASLAAVNDGIIATNPDRELLETFDAEGGEGKPRFAQVTLSWAPTVEKARATAHRWWPTAAIPGPIHWEVATPALFDTLAAQYSEDDVANKIPCGTRAEDFVEGFRAYADAGFDHLYIHQVGPEQEDFLRFFTSELRPALESALR